MKKFLLTMLALGISTLVPVMNAAEKSVPATKPATAASATAGKWLTDYKKAAETAKAEKKLLLLDFTGSDWCIWCDRLDDEVFSTSAFKKYARENLILVKLDFPRGKTLPAAVKKQNDDLKNKHAIKGYPTIIVLDSDENRIGRLGYMEGGPKAFIAALDKLKARAQNAQNDTGASQAKRQQGGKKGKKGPGSTLPDNVKPPRPDPQSVRASVPKYPSSMRNSGIAGAVVVEFIVDTDGKVHSSKIIRSDHRNFEQPALDSVSKLSFTPGTRDGEPVKIIEQATFHFTPGSGTRVEARPIKVAE